MKVYRFSYAHFSVCNKSYGSVDDIQDTSKINCQITYNFCYHPVGMNYGFDVMYSFPC